MAEVVTRLVEQHIAEAAAEESFLASPNPFSNSFFAEPRLRASLGIAVPPNSRATTAMRTMNPSIPNISPTMMISLSSFRCDDKYSVPLAERMTNSSHP